MPGVVCLHVDDLFSTGDDTFHKNVLAKLRRGFQVGSEDKDDMVFVGQRVRWKNMCVQVDQDRATEVLTEVAFDKKAD